MVFNSFGPRNAIFQSSTEAAAPVLAWIHAQCARGACAEQGFAADIWAAHDAGELTAEEAPILDALVVDGRARYDGERFCQCDFGILQPSPSNGNACAPTVRCSNPPLMRFCAGVAGANLFLRTTTRALEVAGVAVPEGAKVLLFLGAANRDPRKWPEPEKFDATRKPMGHVALGSGIHVCVGQLVARLEAEGPFEALAERVQAFELFANHSAS